MSGQTKRARKSSGQALDALLEKEKEHFSEVPEDAEAIARVELFVVAAKALLKDQGLSYDCNDVVAVAELMIVEASDLLAGDEPDDGEASDSKRGSRKPKSKR